MGTYITNKKKQLVTFLTIVILFSFGYTLEKTNNSLSKIYLWNGYLLRSTPNSISFYDVSNPNSPSFYSSISIDGNNDISIKENYLYSDSYNNFITFDISDPYSPTPLDTIKNIFEKSHTFMGSNIVENNRFGCSSCGKQTVTSPTTSGTSGSTARFTIVNDFLYCIDLDFLHILDISTPNKPREVNSLHVAWNIETVYSYNNNLFIGGRNGMYIYNIDDGKNPKYVSEFTHVSSCDPVVVEKNRAYVTLREGNGCNGFTNELDIIDITNIKNPKMISKTEMSYPYGLAVNNHILYICEANYGMTILDVSNPLQIDTLSTIKNSIPNDVIYSENLLYVTGKNSILIIDVSDSKNPKILSEFWID